MSYSSDKLFSLWINFSVLFSCVHYVVVLHKHRFLLYVLFSYAYVEYATVEGTKKAFEKFSKLKVKCGTTEMKFALLPEKKKAVSGMYTHIFTHTHTPKCPFAPLCYLFLTLCCHFWYAAFRHHSPIPHSLSYGCLAVSDSLTEFIL